MIITVENTMIITVAVKAELLLQSQSKHNDYHGRSQNTVIITAAVKTQWL